MMNVLCHAYSDFICKSSWRQQSTGRHAIYPDIFQTLEHPVSVLTSKCCMISGDKQYLPILMTLVWPGCGSNPQPFSLEASMTPLWQFFFYQERALNFILVFWKWEAQWNSCNVKEWQVVLARQHFHHSELTLANYKSLRVAIICLVYDMYVLFDTGKIQSKENPNQ